jgi:hypothetical protein
MAPELSKERPTEPVFLLRSTTWVVGCDLGQSSDPTALCVLEWRKGVLSMNSEWERHTRLDLLPEKLAERLAVRHIERLRLGVSYPEVVQEVKQRLARSPLDAPSTKLIIDETGVGRAVGDIFVQQQMRPERVTITAGSEETTAPGFNRWSVAKTILISRLDAALHTGLLRIAKELREAGPLKEELANFQRSVSAAGRQSYSARVGMHDDLVLATALAVWWATRPPPPQPAFGNYGHV